MNRKLIFFLAVLCFILPLSAEKSNQKNNLNEEYNEALRQLGQNRLDEAIAAYQKIIAVDPTFWRAYDKMISAYRRSAQSAKAQAYFEELLAAHPNHPYIHYGVGMFYHSQGAFQQAIAHYKRCLELKGEFEGAYGKLAEAYRELKKPQEAIDYLEDKLKLNPGNSYAHFGLASIYLAQSAWQKGLHHLDRAVELKPDLTEAYLVRGIIYYNLGRYEAALKEFEKVLELAKPANALEHQSRALGNMGIVYQSQLRYGPALEYLEKSLMLHQQLGDLPLQGRTLTNIGNIHARQGHYGQALESYQKSLALTRQVRDRGGKAANLQNIGNIYWSQGDYEQALSYYQESLALSRELGDRRGEAGNLSNLGNIYRGQGHDEQALEYYQKSLALSQQLGNRGDEAASLNNIGTVYRHQGHYGPALEYYQKDLALEQQLGNRRGEAVSLNNIGRAYLALGEGARAIEHFRLGLKIAKEINDPDPLWRLHNGLAQALETQHPPPAEEAIAHYKSAVEAIRAMRSGWWQPDHKVRFLEDKIEVYQSLCNLLARLHRQPAGAGKGYDREAFQYAEESKARALVELLEESRASINISKGLDADLAERERAVRAGLSDVQVRLEGERQATRIKELEKRRDALYHEYENFIGELRRRNPDYARLSYPEAITLEQCQRLLDEETVLLQYLLGKESSLLFAVSKKGYEVIRIAGRTRLKEPVKKLRETLTLDSTAILQRQLSYVGEARALYDMLIKPAERLLAGKKRIVVAPDGVLYYLPFPTLLTQEVFIAGKLDFKSLPYLVKRYAVSYVPSASVWRALAEQKKEKFAGERGESVRPAEGPVRQKKFLAFADPDYQKKPMLNGSAGSRSRPKEGGLRTASVERSQPWTRLPYAGEEVRRIASLYPKEAVRLFLREEATEENVKNAKLGEYQRIHFAAHGVINESKPQFSGIVLATKEGSGEDGYLQMYEIFNLRLNAQLVVLSGCETGLGKQTSGEGMVGLMRAFLYAGAERIVASLWKIEDRSTAELMRRFYAGLEENSAAQALRSTQLDLINRSPYSHPYFWGAFALYGGP